MVLLQNEFSVKCELLFVCVEYCTIKDRAMLVPLDLHRIIIPFKGVRITSELLFFNTCVLLNFRVKNLILKVMPLYEGIIDKKV